MVSSKTQGQYRTWHLFVLTVIAGLILSFNIWAAGAPRSRVYGFRHTDNKQAIELVKQLGITVTADAHSSTVVVLTGEDPLELKKAYSLMEVCDRKTPVEMKTFGPVEESSVEETLKQIHNLLGNLNSGTFLDPPSKAAANPFIVDVYQGNLIAIATAEELEKVATAYQTNQPLQKQRNIESGKTTATQTKTAAMPSLAEAAALIAEEPNIPEPEPTPPPQPMSAEQSEPNETIVAATEPSVPETIEQPVAETTTAAEPNKASVETPASQDDFMSNELLDTLAAEEKAAKEEAEAAEAAKAQAAEEVAEIQTTAAAETATSPAVTAPEPVEAETVEPQSAEEIADAELAAVVAKLREIAAKEEKAAAAEEAVEEQSQQSAAAEEAQAVSAVKEPAIPNISKAAAEKPIKTEPKKPAVPVKPQNRPSGAAGQTEQKVKAVSTTPEIPKSEEELELTITLPEKVEIKSLIELIGKQLGLNYIYDENKVKGDVMLKVHDGKIKVRDCYALLETVLRYKGFVMTRRGNLVMIVPSAELPVSDPTIRTPDEPIEPGDVIVNSVFTLKHINVNTAQGILRQLNLGTNIILIADTNTLIITDYSYRMEKIERVLRILDVPGKPKTYTYRSLQYMQAEDLIPRLQKLASQMENLSITVEGSPTPAVPSAGAPTRTTVRPGQPATPTPATAASSASPQQQETVFLDADERTNRILMIGNEDQLAMVNNLIDSLDVRQYDLRYVKEYEIKYVDASEVINVLNELSLVKIATTQTTGQTTSRSTVPTMSQRPTTPQQTAAQQAAQQRAAGGSTTEGGTDQPYVSIRPNTNSLLVNATEEQHEDIQLVIQYIDVEQKDQRTIKEYEIQNVDVQEIVQTLGDLGIISKQSVSNITSSKSSMYSSATSMGGTSRIGGTTNRVTGMPADQQVTEQSAVASLLTAEGETIRELITTEPQMSILESTNSLLIHATPRQHASIALVIAHVDRELDRAVTPYVVYPLENQDPEELAATLLDLIEGTTSNKTSLPGGATSASSKIQTEQTGASNLPKKEEERIRVVADTKSYSLIVFANKKNQQWIATLIKELDKYRPQVLLDCTLVSITKDDEFKFDLDMISKKGGLNNTSMTTISNPITAAKTITDTHGTTWEGAVSFGAGNAFYGDNNIQALLNLTDKKGYGRVLGRPSILVKDNEEGVIKAENVKYVAQYSSSTTTTDTTPVTSTNVTFTDYTTGITLTITPHIASEKIMQLEIELDRTDIDPSDTSGGVTSVQGEDYPKPLDTVSSNVKTWSIVPSGATIILGGIETVNQTKGVDKVPFLGDIPLIGLLFRGVSETDNQSKLYIFVKANIIQPGEELTGRSDIERISRKKRDAFEMDETRFQGLHALPGPKPNPMIPTKILEDDEYIQQLRERQAAREADEAAEQWEN